MRENIPSEILSVLIADLGYKPKEILSMSIYQIFIIYHLWLESQLRKRQLIEEIKMFINPEVYWRYIESHRVTRKNMNFEDIVKDKFNVEAEFIDRVLSNA